MSLTLDEKKTLTATSFCQFEPSPFHPWWKELSGSFQSDSTLAGSYFLTCKTHFQHVAMAQANCCQHFEGCVSMSCCNFRLISMWWQQNLHFWIRSLLRGSDLVWLIQQRGPLKGTGTYSGVKPKTSNICCNSFSPGFIEILIIIYPGRCVYRCKHNYTIFPGTGFNENLNKYAARGNVLCIKKQKCLLYLEVCSSKHGSPCSLWSTGQCRGLEWKLITFMWGKILHDYDAIYRFMFKWPENKNRT